MDLIYSKKEENLALAIDYYKFLLNKDFDAMASCLLSDVKVTTPLSCMRSKEEVIKAARRFAPILQDIQINSRFASGNQIMLTYDMMILDPIGSFRTAVIMDFQNNKIAKMEFFYDCRIWEKSKYDILLGKEK